MKKFKKTIGILGGMGPSASGYLYQRIIKLAATEYGAEKNDDFPEVILYSVPVPDFISSVQNKGRALSMLLEKVEECNKSSVDMLALACNTAHSLLPQLQKAADKLFISLIDAVSKKITCTPVGILATSTTIKENLYQSKISGKKRLLFPKDQKGVDEIVRSILAGKAGKKDAERLRAIANSLKEKGAEAILLGCTELPLLFPKKYSLPVLNSVDILARELLEQSMV